MTALVRVIEQVPVGTLTEYPGNARRGDVDAIAASLDENGQFAPVIVQQSTRYVLSGNHTVKAACQLGWETIAVTWVDVDDAQARKIVLAANRIPELGTYDHTALAGLLGSLDGDYAGSGWDAGDFDSLLALIEAPDLDEVAGKVGEPGADDMWPVIRIKVPHEVAAAWKQHVKDSGQDEAAALAALIGAA